MKTNYYSSSWFKKPIFSSSWQKCMVLAIFLLMVVSSVFADSALPVYRSSYSSAGFYKTRINSQKKTLPVFVDPALPVYHSPYRSSRRAQTSTSTLSIANTSTSDPYTTAAFTVTDYTQRKPFEETDVSMLSSQNRPMRAPMEDDPPFPGDPGQMPVGDGLGFLLLAAAGYSFFKMKKSKTSKT